MNDTYLNHVDQPKAYSDIFDQYVTEASFLWVLRSISVNQPHYDLSDLIELEARIDANLDGLMSSPEQSWTLCKDALTFEQAGEVFTATIIAFRSHDASWIQAAVTAGLVNNETFKGLISGLAWLPAKLVQPWIQKFLNSKDLDHKYLAIAACSVRGENPGELLAKILQREDCLAHENLHARALRLIGELKLQDFQWAVENARASENECVKFWANWSAILLGNRSAVNQLQDMIDHDNPLQQNALQIAFRVLPLELGRAWISRLAEDKSQARTVIKASGILGDPHAVPWLIGKMREVDMARLAGEAFTMITGIDLERYQLAIDVPEDITVVPNDATPSNPSLNGSVPVDDMALPEDDDVGMDDDEHLPFPDTDKIAITWRKHGMNYIPGKRYFFGSEVNVQSLQEKISNGYQRQRHAAALELTLLEVTMPLINTSARADTSI